MIDSVLAHFRLSSGSIGRSRKIFSRLSSTRLYGLFYGLSTGGWVLGLTCIAVLFSGPSVHATPSSSLRCEQLFEHSPARSSMIHPAANDLADHKAFDYRRFQTDLYYYRHVLKSKLAPSDIRRPESAESKMAFFEASSQVRGNGLLKLKAWLKTAQAHEVQAITDALIKFDFQKGLRPKEGDEAFARLYLLSHADPRSYVEVSRRPIPETERRMIIQRVEMDLGSKSLTETMENLGFNRAPNIFDRMQNNTYEGAPNVVNAVAATGLGFLSYWNLGYVFYVPELSLLKTLKLPEDLRSQLGSRINLSKGLDRLYPDLKNIYGNSARFDLAWHWARRAMMAGLIAYMLGQSYVDLLPGLAPPGHVNPDDSVWQMSRDVMQSWVSLFYVHIGHTPPLSEEDRQEIRSFTKDINQLKFD